MIVQDCMRQLMRSYSIQYTGIYTVEAARNCACINDMVFHFVLTKCKIYDSENICN